MPTQQAQDSHLVHPHDLVVEFVVAGGRGEEGVAVCDEQVEDVHDLQREVNRYRHNRDKVLTTVLHYLSYLKQCTM